MSKKSIALIILSISLILISVLFFDIFLPMLLGLIIAYILNPIIEYLEKIDIFKGKRTIILSFLLISLGALFTYTTILIFTSINSDIIIKFLYDISNYNYYINTFLSEFISKIDIFDFQINLNNFIPIILKEFEGFLRQVLFSISSIFTGIFTSIVFVIILILSSFYILKDKEHFIKICKNYTTKKTFNFLKEIFLIINEKIGGYFKGLLLTSLIIGVSISLFLLFFQPFIEHALLFGLIAGIANIIPYLGPFIGGAPIVIFSLVQLSNKHSLIIILYLIIINAIIGFIIYPKLISRKVNIHPLIIIISILIGNQILGILGMLIAIPIIIILKLILKLVFKYYIIKI